MTAVDSAAVDAPSIEEFPFARECWHVQSLEVGQHVMIVGEVVNMSADSSCLGKKGNPDIWGTELLIYDQADNSYKLAGEKAGKAFSDGAKLLKRVQ